MVALENKVEVLQNNVPTKNISEEIPQPTVLIRRNSLVRKATPPKVIRVDSTTRQPIGFLKSQKPDSTAEDDYQKTYPIRIRQHSNERNDFNEDKYKKVVQVNVESLSPVRRDLSASRRRNSLVRVESGLLNISNEKTSDKSKNEKDERKDIYFPDEGSPEINKKSNIGFLYAERANESKRKQFEETSSIEPVKREVKITNKDLSTEKVTAIKASANDEDDWDKELFGEEDEIFTKQKQDTKKIQKVRENYSPNITTSTNDAANSQVNEVIFVRKANVHNDWDDEL